MHGAEGQRANSWHTDVTFVDAYPKASILRSVVCPEVGGDTIWTNMVAAYENLAPTTQAAIQNLFDADPPFYDASTGLGFDPGQASPLGRIVSLQLTRRW